MEVLTHLLKPDILELLVGFAVLVTILVLAGSVFQKISSCPYRKFCAAHEGCHSPNRTASLKQFAALPQSGERNSAMHASAREHSSNTKSNGPRRESA